MSIIDRKTIPDDKKQELFKEFDKQVSITSVLELQEMLNIILSNDSDKEIELSVKMEWSENNKQESSVVKGLSRDTSIYRMLVDGLQVVKNRLESMDKVKNAIDTAKSIDNDLQSNLLVWDINNIRFNVDNLIEKRLGGKRNGIRIRWDLNNEIYEFDVFSKKLFKVENNESAEENSNK